MKLLPKLKAIFKRKKVAYLICYTATCKINNKLILSHRIINFSLKIKDRDFEGLIDYIADENNVENIVFTSIFYLGKETRVSNEY